MAASPTDIEEFLGGPLVKWLSTCVKKPDCLQVYETFFDGTAINEVLLQIDPEPSLPVPTTANLQGLHITAARTKVFHCIIRNIKSIYEEELGQVIISLPDCVTLGRTPASQTALEQLKLLILLLLGCAVQGPTKESFIARIKELDLEVQHNIVECIKQVTDGQNLVLTGDCSNHSTQNLYLHVRSLTTERDKLLQQWVIDLGQENNGNIVKNGTEEVESNHWAVELADWKAKLRKQRQELEEKTEILTEYKEELEHANNLVTKLKAENSDLLTEARKAKAYRDEVDAIRERAERADRLELEVQRYRERLADAEFYKVRVDELREDNRVLLETREILEAQLVKIRQRADQVLELEAELLACKQNTNDLILERDAAREKIQELVEENLQLQQITKSALQDTSLGNITTDSDQEESNSGDNSLSEQLTNNAQARALKLELENKRLLTTIESLKENNFRETSGKILDLEKEKKKLSLKCEQLQENGDRLAQQNSELESLFKNAIVENKKLQANLDSQKLVLDRQNQEVQNEKTKIGDLEKTIDGLSKEKQRVQALCDAVKKRADDAEKCLNQTMEEVRALQRAAEEGRKAEIAEKELQERVAVLEKENAGLQKEAVKLKEAVEAKDVLLDVNIGEKEKKEKEMQRLQQRNVALAEQLEKLQEFEKKSAELVSRASVDADTISALQRDLVRETVGNEKLKSNLEKLGLSLDVLDGDVNLIVARLLDNENVSKCVYSIIKENKCIGETACKTCEGNVLKQTEEVVKSVVEEWRQRCEKLQADVAASQSLKEALQNENATLKVDVSTLKSHVHTLQTQQTALQLANSQLVAEKEELSKRQRLQTDQQGALLSDQATLRSLHDQLGREYEELKTERESLKRTNRDLRSEIRSLKETNDGLEVRISNVEMEKENLRADARNLNNLRAEHSKLKDDFRNLFTASERLKVEYRNLQDELKNLRLESRNLRLRETEIQDELSTRSDKAAGLQLDNAKLQQKCDMLFEMNNSLDADRRALMDHVSQLLTQYHSLLTHSLEDKQHYHLEEKLFTDKVNNLCRQKEKLEEKIMEHYRKLDNASAKKRGFSTFVSRVRKASSDVINKVPSRNRRSWHEDSARLTQSQFTLAGPGSGESDNRDSDNSAEEPAGKQVPLEPFKRNTIGTGSLHGHKPRDEVALRRSHRDLGAHRTSIASDGVFGREPGSPLSLGSVGSRRTVYLSEEDAAPVSSSPPAPPPVQPLAPLLVYNRISTVIGGDATQSQPKLPPSPQVTSPPNNDEGVTNGEKRDKNSKETAIWYEYGCV